MRSALMLALCGLAVLTPAAAQDAAPSAPVAASTDEAQLTAPTPDDVHSALKRQLTCLDDCLGTRVAVTAFGGATIGPWRHASAEERAKLTGAVDDWVAPTTATFQVKRFFNDYTLVEDHVWDGLAYRGEGGALTILNTGEGTTSQTVESREAAQLPPSP